MAQRSPISFKGLLKRIPQSLTYHPKAGGDGLQLPEASPTAWRRRSAPARRSCRSTRPGASSMEVDKGLLEDYLCKGCCMSLQLILGEGIVWRQLIGLEPETLRLFIIESFMRPQLLRCSNRAPRSQISPAGRKRESCKTRWPAQQDVMASRAS